MSTQEIAENKRQELLSKIENSGLSDYTATKIKTFLESEDLKIQEPSVQLTEINLLNHKITKFKGLHPEVLENKRKFLENEMVFLSSTFKSHIGKSKKYIYNIEQKRLAGAYEVANGEDILEKKLAFDMSLNSLNYMDINFTHNQKTLDSLIHEKKRYLDFSDNLDNKIKINSKISSFIDSLTNKEDYLKIMKNKRDH